MRTVQYTDGTYLEKVQDWHVSDSPWKAARVFQMIERNRLTFHSVYDVGCGAGQVLVELRRMIPGNALFAGFDISPQAIDLAKTREDVNLKFYNADFLKAEGPSPDLILLLDVFEHVPDYLGFLDAMKKKADWIIFHIPLDMCARAVLRNSGYMLYMRKQYGHLHYFSKETALATLSDLGYEIVDYFYTLDDEIGGERAVKGLGGAVNYRIRQAVFRLNPGFAAAFFTHFNLMVLARGDNKQASGL